MSLLIANGIVSGPQGLKRLDIFCENDRITALLEPGHHIDADQIIDAEGKLIFPGFIDPHVHSRDPGATEKEDFEHATRGALSGGVTTILEMPNAVPAVDSLEVFEERVAHHALSAWTDFGLWGLSLGESNLDQLELMFAAGAAAVELFWGYGLTKDTKQLVYNLGDVPADQVLQPPHNGGVLAVFREVARIGGLLAAHCEDKDILASAQDELGHPIETYEDLLAARPDYAESASIATGAEFARVTGCRFHVVHIASKKGVETVRAAQQRDIPVTGETCPHFASLTNEDFKRVGPAMKVYPPIRRAHDQESLWEGIGDGTIVSIGSDHAPHLKEEKAKGLAGAPAGLVGAETFGPVMIDSLLAGRLSVARFTEVMSASTARLYGLYPRKGVVQPGADADLTIVDPEAVTEVQQENLIAKQPVSPWHGQKLHGRVDTVVLRGQVAFDDGEPVGERRGKFIAADHQQTHDELSNATSEAFRKASH